MSTLNQLLDFQEQICYVQCGYCTTILLVSVPYSSLSMVVTVRCGHCTSLLSVNMMKASFIPMHLLTSLNQDESKQEVSPELGADAEKGLDKRSPSLVISSDDEDDDEVPVNHIVNRPPEKRQRAPSAYNNFIKEEIRRLKAKYPNMTHKEAFSAAAKNSKQEVSPELGADAEKGLDKRSPSLVISSDDEDDDEVPVNHIVNRPPEKRQRAPSAYNNFIKEEIRRLKAKYPNMTHKEAFSAAAKNWAHFPPSQYKRDGESCGQGPERKMPRSSAVGEKSIPLSTSRGGLIIAGAKPCVEWRNSRINST
ncbi:plant-specific transcription factor YABBY family protein [Actinidia rufa]|uniref:Plant-specific transcription factor YABBY family protein n=1 Tax=Actinidia rufa TaxID=165716 RepID=A0A7J0EYP5_9ERIC|nr:plant-specific transcription factor YABBY family protein [Actinidia rufa]